MQNNSIHNDRGFQGTGEPYFYPDGGGNPFYFGNPVSFKLTSSFDKKERISKRKRDAGAALDTIIVPKPAEVSFTTDTFQPRNWAMALMGESSRQTTASQAFAAEAAVAVLDGYHQLANVDIDETTVVVSKGGAALPDTAFSLEPVMGLLQITDETAAAAGDALTVNYTTLATTKTVIDGARVTRFTGKIVINGWDEVRGKRATITVPGATLAVEGDFDWFSDDFNSIEMKGTAAVVDGKPPYTVELYD